MGDYDARGTYLGPELHNAAETRFDALRAVTYVHLQAPETRETIALSREVLDALGLLPEGPRDGAAGQLDVPCPQCGSGEGAYCTTESGEPYRKGHRTRHRRAQEIREGAA